MRKYLVVAQQSFLVSLAYSSNMLVWTLIAMLELVVPMAIWFSATPVGDTFGGYSRLEIISYYGLMSIVGFATFWWLQFEIARLVRTGDLSNYLVKPMSFFKYMVSGQIGEKVLMALIRLPIFVGVFVLFGSQLFSGLMANLGWAIITILVGGLLGLLIALSFGMLAFWITDFGGFAGLYFFSSYLLSGEMAPLTVFPEWFTKIAHVLPYRYVLSFPIEIIMNRLTGTQILQGLAIETTWIIVMVILLKFLWKKGLVLYQAYGK